METHDGEDVELVISGGGVAHAITLTGFSCTAPTDCIMTYQDPNSPTAQQTTQVFGGAKLVFEGLPGTDPGRFARTFFTIDAAFSESPIPEPSSVILLGTGIAAMIGNWMRRKAISRRSRSTLSAC